MKKLRFVAMAGLLIAPACKPRDNDSGVKAGEESAAKPSLAEKILDKADAPCLALEANTASPDIARWLKNCVSRDGEFCSSNPWVRWQWYAGARHDEVDLKGNRVEGIGCALVPLDRSRIRLVNTNIVDTNGAYGDRGTIENRPAEGGGTQPRKVWKAYQAGDCGKRDMTNPKYAYRSFDGSCNDFDNPPMGMVGERFARNARPDAVNDAIKDFENGGGNSPDVGQISDQLLKRQDPFKHNPAPFFNVWAAAWIQFMTHDWFQHSVDGQADNSRPMQAGKFQIGATPADDGQGRRGESPTTKTFRNNITFWWDASQIYGWDDARKPEESKGRMAAVRDPKDRAKLWLTDKKLLPLYSEALTTLKGGGLSPNFSKEDQAAAIAFIESQQKRFGDQELAAFGDSWWTGIALLQTAWVNEHNFIVEKLRKGAKPPSGAAKWSDDELYSVARLAITAIIMKVHTIEWTPQLLYNRVGEVAMNSNWEGIIALLARCVAVGDVPGINTGDACGPEKQAAKKALLHTVEQLKAVAAAGAENLPEGTKEQFASVKALAETLSKLAQSDESAKSLSGKISQSLASFVAQSTSLGKAATEKSILGLRDGLHSFVQRLQWKGQDDIVSLLAATGGIVGMKQQEHFNSPFTLPEEFTAVYRLHALVPDYMEIYKSSSANQGRLEPYAASELSGMQNMVTGAPETRPAEEYWWRPESAATPEANAKLGKNMVGVTSMLGGGAHRGFVGMGADGIQDFALSFGVTPLGQLTLGNFPAFMTDMKFPGSPGGRIDLAAIDVLRDRERGIPRYNEFRRQLGLKPITAFEDFLPENASEDQKAHIAKMKEVYGGDVEKIDLFVGDMAEYVRPWGYAINETQFQVFILNASRRLFSDRFVTEGFTAKHYTQVGLDHVNNTLFFDVLRRAYPKLVPAMKNVKNSFDLWQRNRGTKFEITANPKDFNDRF